MILEQFANSGSRLTRSVADLAVVIQYGYTAKARSKAPGPRYLRITDIQNDAVDWSQVPSCDIAEEDVAKYKLEPGDLVFARTGATVGKSYLIRPGAPKSVFASYLIRIRFGSGVDPRYVAYFFRSLSYWHQINENQAGIGQPNVNGKKLAQVCLPVGPIDEQCRIVAEIEKQFSRLDEAVANLKRVKANLKRYKAAVLKAAVEGHLVPTEAQLARREGRSYETSARLMQGILDARRRTWRGRGKYKEPGEPDTSDLPNLPDGWTWATVDQLAAAEPNAITDGPFGSNMKTEHYKDAGPRVIRLQNIKDGEFADEYAHITQDRFERLRKHEICAGDLVIASLGDNPPRACIIPPFVGPAIVKADCIRFKPHSSLAVAYLNTALNCQPTRQRIKDVIHGIGRPRLSLGEIRAISLPIPPEVEQRRIVAEVERHFSIVREVETEVDTNLKRAQALRQATLSAAFNLRLSARQ